MFLVVVVADCLFREEYTQETPSSYNQTIRTDNQVGRTDRPTDRMTTNNKYKQTSAKYKHIPFLMLLFYVNIGLTL